MDTELALLNSRLHLLAAPRPQLDRLIQASLARLGLAGRVHVIDAGNRFDAYAVARLVRRQTRELVSILSSIDIARAFTCYQVLALLEAQAADAIPLLVLDLLVTFGDENVRLMERSRLLDGCISQLKRLAGRAPVLVTSSVTAARASGARQSAALPGDFPARLAAAAGQVWRFEPVAPAAATCQLPLFQV